MPFPRVFSYGPCTGRMDTVTNSFQNSFQPRASKDFTEMGTAIRGLTNRSMKFRYSTNTTTALTTLTNKMYLRFWIRVRRYPMTSITSGLSSWAVGMCNIAATQASLEGGVNTVLMVTASGRLKFLNHGNLTTPNDLWTSNTPLQLMRWYKVEWFVRCNRIVGPPSVPDGEARVRISDENGLLEDSGVIKGGTNNAGFNVIQNIYETAIGRRAGGATDNGFDCDFSHVACDLEKFPEDSRVTAVPCVAAGTYQQWTTGNPAYQARNMTATSGGSEQVTFVGNSGGLRRQTYRVKPLRECGITGPIYSVRVAIDITATGAGHAIQVVLMKNGIVHLHPSSDALGLTQYSIRFDEPISPDDVIEIGVDTHQTSGTTGIAGLWLLVDHASPVTEIQTADFQVGAVEWVGNGTALTVPLPFVPSFVIIWPKSPQPDVFGGISPPTGGIWWDTLGSFHDMITEGPRRDQAKVLVDRQQNTAVLNLVGSYPRHNTNGMEYWALLIRDPVNRIHARGSVLQDSQTTPFDTDNISYPIDAGTATPTTGAAFTPEAMFLYKETDNTSSTAYFKGPLQVGDQTMAWGGSSPVADVIQQLLPNGFQLGKTAYVTADRSAFLAMRKDAFANQRLFNIVTWHGNGSTADLSAELPRRISVDLGGKAPEAILVIPTSGTNQRFWHAKLVPSQLNGFTNEAAIDSAVALDGTIDGVGMTVPTNVGASGSKPIVEAHFWLKKTGNPTGPIRARLYNTSASAPINGSGPIATSDPIDASTLTGSFQMVRFTFPLNERFPIVRGVTYFIDVEYAGSLADSVDVAVDASSPVGSGTLYRLSGGAFTIDNTRKALWRVSVGAASAWTASSFDQLGILWGENDGFVVGHSINAGTVVGSNAFTNQNSTELLDGDPTATAQTFTASADGTLGRCVFQLKKTGIPVGQIVAKLYATAAGVPTGAPLATSEPKFVADFNNEFLQAVAFEFTGVNAVSISNGTVYAIALEYLGVVTDYVEVGQDNTPAHAGTKYNFSGGVWTADAGADLTFQVTVLGSIGYTALVWSIGLDGLGLPPTGIWHEFLVAGHACKSIDAWYVGGIRQPVSSAQGDPDTEAYFLVPGYSAYESAFGSLVKTRTYNGRVYTCVYVKEGGGSPLDVKAIIEGETPLTVNVQGIEDVGDGSGNLIEESFSVYRHLMQNWVFGDYQAGSWLTTPTFPDAENVPMMDDASFTNCASIASRRLEDGYKAAGAIGAMGETVSVRVLIRMLNQSCDCDSGLNRKCQFFVTMVDDSAVVALFSPELTDVGDILRATLEIEDDFSNHFNAIPYVFARDYSTDPTSVAGTSVAGAEVDDSGSEWRARGRLTSAESIANYGDTLTMEKMELGFVRNEIVAKDIVRRKLLRHKDPPRLVRLSTHAKGFNIELGDTRLVSHFGGIGATGWVNQPVRIQRHIAFPQGARVDFEGYDMQRLFASVFILGDETALQPLWTLAVGADAGDRIYGYLGDETTGKFSDGEDAKRVR